MEQIDELLSEVKPSTKKVDALKHFVEKLQSMLLHVKRAKREHQVFRETEVVSLFIIIVIVVVIVIVAVTVTITITIIIILLLARLHIV